jgi:hypothetical protein
LFEAGKTPLDAAQEVHISIDLATELQQKWQQAKTKQQTMVFTAFGQGKDIMSIAVDLGIRPEEVESHYRQYLKYQGRQQQIQKEVDQGIGGQKKFESPYTVTKMVRNQWTGRGWTVETAPISFDEPPKSYKEFQQFAMANGDGIYMILDASGKKAGQITVAGMGFNDPSDLDEFGDNGMQMPGRNRMMRRGMGGMGRGMVPLGGNPYDPYNQFTNPYPGAYDPNSVQAQQILGEEQKRKSLYYKVAEMAAIRGDGQTAAKYLQMADYGTNADPKAKEHKSLLDELIDIEKNKDAGGLLRKIFGGKEDKDEDSEEIKKMKAWSGIINDAVPKIKENIIDPVMDGISGESKGVRQLERETGISERGGGSSPFQRGGSLGGGGWKIKNRIGGKQPQQPQQHFAPMTPAEQNPALPPVRQQAPPPAPTQPTRPTPPPEIQERVEMVDGVEDEDDNEMERADDYGQPITPEDLKDLPRVNKVEDVDPKKMSIDEKYTLNKLFPRFKETILAWKSYKEAGDEEKVRAFLPERVAREDYHTMTKSSYAVFIGKARLLKAYQAAKEGYDGILGKYKPTIEKKLAEARNSGMDGMAEQLRKFGTKKFAQMWKPPEGVNKKAGIIQLLKYILLKDCWTVFSTKEGREWFTAYGAEFVKAVEEDYISDDKKRRIQAMIDKPHIEPNGGETNARMGKVGTEGAGTAAEPAESASSPAGPTGPTNGTGTSPAGPAGKASG